MGAFGQLLSFHIKAMITGTPMKSNMAGIAQSGAVTHHHDQAITFTNLSTKNTINNNPGNPIPIVTSSIS